MRTLQFRLSLVTLLVVVGLTSTAVAQSSEWETLRPEKEVFSIEIPKGSTTETGTETYHKMELNTRYYVSANPAGPVFAIASFSGIPPSTQYTELQRLNSYVDAFKTLFPAKLKGKVAPVKLTIVGAKQVQGNPGREYRLTIGDLSGTVHAFATRRRFYAVVYLNPKKDDALQEKFLSSFVLPERVDAPPPAATAQAPTQPREGATATPGPNGVENPATANATTKPGEPKPVEADGTPKKPRPINGGVLKAKPLVCRNRIIRLKLKISA